ncbi:MAG TPA: HU family DNA-binding protein, partial [Ignavibacteria bacterium]|nr:HU family DNA-binding protein [Ignavibacteria bacterium]
MIKQEIIEKISKYFKLTNFEAEKIYDDIFAGIIKGVKEDNIADITNLGEFIIKYNSGDENNKKTVEFLPTLSLEEEINQRAFEESRQFEPPKFVNQQLSDKPFEKAAEPPVSQLNDPDGTKTPDIKTTENLTTEQIPVISEEEKLSIEQEHTSVEDE